MKRFRDIQFLLIFFMACFLAASIALIVTFKNSIGLATGIGFAAFVGTWLMARSLLTLNGYFHAFKQREARLMLLASRDPATGLFQRNGFEWMLAKEIERAKRKDFSLTLMLVQVEPYQNIEADIGIPATERLLFQIGESLQNTCRAYDNLFRLDTNTFALFFTETKNEDLEKIVKRLQRRLQKTAFLVNSDRVKITPLFKLGAGVYPIDGTNPQSLEAFARSNLSITFDAEQIHHPEKSSAEFFEVLPTVKPLESPVPNSSMKIHTLAQNKALEPVFTKQDVFIEPPVSLETPSIAVETPTIQTEIITPLDPQDLQGTPEMDAFQSELKSLFARTNAIEESVQKLIADEMPLAVKKDVAAVAQVSQTAEPIKNNPIKPLSLEPLPAAAGLSYFQRLAQKTDAAKSEVAANLEATLNALSSTDKDSTPVVSKPVQNTHEVKSQRLVVAAQAKQTADDDNSWSIDDLANMPDVVAAIMQNDIHESVSTKTAPLIARQATPAKVQKIEIVHNGSEPIIQVDFQK